MINRIWMFLILTLSCVQISSAQEQSKLPTIEEILALPENQIDVGYSSLILAKKFYPKSQY